MHVSGRHAVNRSPANVRFEGWAAALLVLMLVGCSTSSDPSSRLNRAEKRQIETALRETVADWRGTPHRMGGTSRRGIDCSGFVMRIYDDLFDVSLPRSTRRQVNAGSALQQDNLRAGDLVLFRPGGKSRHIGVYLSNDEFAHVSSTRGVTISKMSTPYWQRSYWTARRVLPAAPAKPTATAPATSSQEPEAGRRGSW